ncbi:PorP/SprF family type IX secretion system membrane protein [Aquimarina sp. TRL1]|uniref:PorP/SprF family type IX secretion system membrane protein n=1 Tax=Aquimarina sp. (strain TRL1) TaxID=2736252 RepID=UPI00158ED2E7|nr:PorP/SprF family type IX secretion system membrane protein [Aquimarina sp. TRL1]QKX05553.1 PorP/SprF family type IX secretion system membrane protein [Aquimarina sp. TRL1]
MTFQFRYKLFSILLFVLISVQAQQSPVLANYNYNTVLINPAHAGFYKDSDLSLSSRGGFHQIDGAPRTISGIFNTSFESKRTGLAAGVVSDQIGVTSSSLFFGSYAYKIPLRKNSNNARWWDYNPKVISMGITAGIMNWSEDLARLNITNDPNFENNIKETFPVIHAGILYNDTHFFAGLSATNIISSSTKNATKLSVEKSVYAHMGVRFFISKYRDHITLTPSVLIKHVSGAPVQVDSNFIFKYKHIFEIGTGYRSTNAINVLAGLYAAKHWHLVYNYNFRTNNSPVNNTHGLILRYRFGNGFSSKR